MTALVFAMLGLLQPAPQDAFAARCDVQGIYNVLTQATLSARTAEDVELFHSAYYEPGWAFVDARGQRHSWAEVRELAIQALAGKAADQTRQAIRDLTPTSDGAVAVIVLATVRTFVDHEGRYGTIGATHTLAEVATYRDTWIKAGIAWKMALREQVGEPTTLIDKLPPEIDDPRCPT